MPPVMFPFITAGEALRRALTGSTAAPTEDANHAQEDARVRLHDAGTPAGDRQEGRGERAERQTLVLEGSRVGRHGWPQGRGSAAVRSVGRRSLMGEVYLLGCLALFVAALITAVRP